jgi:hypothetical protein
VNQPHFRYPLLAFTSDLDMWVFESEEELTTCGPLTLRDHMQDGMEVVDAEGRSWRVRSMRRLGPARISLRTILRRLSKIEHLWEELPSLTLAELKDRVCASVAAHADCQLHFPDDTAELAARQADVRAADSIAAICELSGLDNFTGY